MQQQRNIPYPAVISDWYSVGDELFKTVSVSLLPFTALTGKATSHPKGPLETNPVFKRGKK